MKTYLALTASAGLALAAFGLQPGASSTAQAAPQTQHRACFYSSQVTNYQPYDDRTIYLSAGGHRVFRIDLANDCPARTGDGHLLVEPVTGSICGPLDFNLSVVSNGFRQHCMVRDLVQLTPDEIAALPRRARP